MEVVIIFYSSVIAVCITGGEDTRSVSAVILSSLSLEPFTSCYFFSVNIKIKNNAHYNFQIVLVNSLRALFVAADILRLEMRLYASTHFVLV